MRLLEWLRATSSHVPRAQRHPCTLAAHFWDGGEACAGDIREISVTGAYLVTSERWYLGTILNVTIQCEPKAAEPRQPPEPVTVPCKVVRHGADGMGVEFVFTRSQDRKKMQNFVKRVASRNSRVLSHDSEGQSLIEFALMVPLLFLLIVNAFNFGGFIYAWITVANAARAGAQYAALGSSSVKTPPEAKASDVVTLVQQETSSLPNSSATNPVVTACQNNSGTVTLLRSVVANSCPAGVTAPPTDPETITGAVTYTTVAVDVTYTYQPFISLFDLPGLGIHATLPPTSIHRRAIMRILN